MFACIKKSQIISIIIIIVLIISSSVVIKTVSAKETETVPSIGITIVIDAGHGGIDPGGIGIKTKVKESELNLDVAFKLAKNLKNIGINCIMTRTNSNGLYGIYTADYKKRDMQKRKEIIDKANPDMVVSVHMNRYVRSSLRGAQVFYDKKSNISKKLAESIQHYFKTSLPESTKGVSVGDYFMLKCTDSPSVIAECGFLSNEYDEALLINDAYQEKVAYAIFCGIIEYLALPY
ncbi:MAG: N-acetylmuramoyl-L-alanine amidase [Clostridia bacterium]